MGASAQSSSGEEILVPRKRVVLQWVSEGLDLNQWTGGSRSGSWQPVRRGDPCSLERLLAISRGRPSHVALHVGQAGAARAGSHVGASRTGRKIPGTDRADLIQLRGMVPNV